MLIVAFVTASLAQDSMNQLPEFGEVVEPPSEPVPLIEVASGKKLVTEHADSLRSCFDIALDAYRGSELPKAKVTLLIEEDGAIVATLLTEGSKQGDWPYYLNPRSVTCAENVFASYRVPPDPTGAWVETHIVIFPRQSIPTPVAGR